MADGYYWYLAREATDMIVRRGVTISGAPEVGGNALLVAPPRSTEVARVIGRGVCEERRAEG